MARLMLRKNPVVVEPLARGKGAVGWAQSGSGLAPPVWMQELPATPRPRLTDSQAPACSLLQGIASSSVSRVVCLSCHCHLHAHGLQGPPSNVS